MPSAEAVELALMSLPGVELAVFARDEEARGSLRIRIAPGHAPDLVAENVSRALWERFSIELPPESLLPGETSPVTTNGSPVGNGSADVIVVDSPAQAANEEREVEPVGADAAGAPVVRPDDALPTWDDVLFRVPVSGTGTRDVRIVDATVEGAGLGRRAVVVLNEIGPSGGQTALGASLVGGSDAVAVAAATLKALTDLN